MSTIKNTTVQNSEVISHILTNKMHQLQYNKSDHKTHFILHTNSYMLWHQDVIFREFINNKGSKSNRYFRC